MLPDVKGRIVAAALALLMAVAMFASTTYAWLTISRAPEAKGMSTTLSGNGNLDYAFYAGGGRSCCLLRQRNCSRMCWNYCFGSSNSVYSPQFYKFKL